MSRTRRQQGIALMVGNGLMAIIATVVGIPALPLISSFVAGVIGGILMAGEFA